MFKMRSEAIAMANVLLKHHKTIRKGQNFDKCLIPYGKLCDMANVPWLTHNPGPFLGDIAQWCKMKGWPPLNALAVRADLRHPGDGYDKAAGCSLVDWVSEAEACISFTEYPEQT
jgi:hypothetical protein